MSRIHCKSIYKKESSKGKSTYKKVLKICKQASDIVVLSSPQKMKEQIDTKELFDSE